MFCYFRVEGRSIRPFIYLYSLEVAMLETLLVLLVFLWMVELGFSRGPLRWGPALSRPAPRGEPTAPRGEPTAPLGEPTAPRGEPTAPRGEPTAPRRGLDGFFGVVFRGFLLFSVTLFGLKRTVFLALWVILGLTLRVDFTPAIIKTVQKTPRNDGQAAIELDWRLIEMPLDTWYKHKQPLLWCFLMKNNSSIGVPKQRDT